MPNNSLDFSLQYFGPATEQDLYTVVSEAELPKLEGFLESYRAFARSGAGALPKLSSSILRPYLPYVAKPNWAVGGLQLDYHTLKTEGAEWAIADAIKHRLLYCHSLALDDPLGHLLALTTIEMQTKQSNDSGRIALLQFINLLLHFQSLIRNHTLCLIPNRIYSDNWVTRGRKCDEFVSALKQSSAYDPSEFMEAAPAAVQSVWKAHHQDADYLSKVAAHIASSRIAAVLEAMQHMPDTVSLFLPFRADVEFLKADTRLSAEIAADGFSDRDSWLLNELIDFDMPGLAELGPSELVNIRAGTEFTEWRQALSKALIMANALPSTLWNRDEDVKRTVREQLAESRGRLEEQFSKSPTLTGLKKGTTVMLVGLVGLGVSALIDPTKVSTVALAALLAQSGMESVMESSGTPSPSSGTKAMLAHYVAALK